jgi:hypothetical protein
MYPPDRLARLRIRRARNRARIQHDEIGLDRIRARLQPFFEYSTPKRHGIRLGSPASEILNEKCSHALPRNTLESFFFVEWLERL